MKNKSGPDGAQDKLRTFAVVELFGHVRLVGLVEESEVAGHGFLRVDLLPTASGQAHTQFVQPKAIYRFTPCDEETAKRLARTSQSAPFTRFELEPAGGQLALTGTFDDPNADDAVDEHDDGAPY